MSHELRTPMNAVLGYAQLLESDSEEPLSQDQRESVAEILRSGQHMLELINGLLNLSEMESGKVALDLKDQMIGPLIGECEKMIQPLAEQRGINLDIRRPDGDLPLVRT
ncbi:MAG: hybrid sensor histidine kinase/response regulator, partial [Rhodospirillales bacterium]|nr:hybrid sensor histidine kinase/response regulator [Rhodospirillales bacterium]